ncbi:MAG TPA: hypothetical protein VG963_18950 [Polyangiaceae bacterium]|nr:hypothetical protein [Polyangiaceae bacterium]
MQRDLATPGAWKCQRDRSQDATAPRGSFALPPIEVYDAPPSGTDFMHGDLAGPEWLPAVPLEHQLAWGALAPRSIPPLERSFVSASNGPGFIWVLDRSRRGERPRFRR